MSKAAHHDTPMPPKQLRKSRTAPQMARDAASAAAAPPEETEVKTNSAIQQAPSVTRPLTGKEISAILGSIAAARKEEIRLRRHNREETKDIQSLSAYSRELSRVLSAHHKGTETLRVTKECNPTNTPELNRYINQSDPDKTGVILRIISRLLNLSPNASLLDRLYLDNALDSTFRSLAPADCSALSIQLRTHLMELNEQLKGVVSCGLIDRLCRIPGFTDPRPREADPAPATARVPAAMAARSGARDGVGGP